MNKIIEKAVVNFYNMLNESRADKLAIRFLKSKGVTDYDQQMKIIGSLKHDVPNIREEHGKFVLGGLRCYYDGQLSNADDVCAFDKALGYIFKGGHTNDYDENLNGLTVKELTDTYKDVMKGDLQADIIRSNNRVFTGSSDYTVIPIERYEDAKKYKKYTSWCVTQAKCHFSGYVGNGTKRFYFCIKKGFESVSKKTADNVPLDEYGLSMISVLIDNTDGGSVDRITTRWNHEYNGENNNKLCTAEQLEDIINLPFYKTFKPYSREELHDRGVVMFDEVQDLLDKGIEPKKIFDNVHRYVGKYARVSLHDKNNFITKNKKNRVLLFDNWYEYLGDLVNNEFTMVKITGKGYNLIDVNENILLPECYDYITGAGMGMLMKVQRHDNKYNFIDKHGKVQFTDWFDDICWANDDYAGVQMDGKYNYISKDDKYVSKTWYDNIYYYDKMNIFKVKKGDLYNIMDTDGELIFQDWYIQIERISDTQVKVYNNGKSNIFDMDKGFVSDVMYEKIECMYGMSGFFQVCNNGLIALMDSHGNVISDWYKNIYSHGDSILAINKQNKVNILNDDGTPKYNKWYDEIGYFENGIAQVELNGKCNFIDENGNEKLDKWFDQCSHMINGFIKVMNNGKYNFVNVDTGKLLTDVWFDYAYSFIFSPDYTVVYISKKPVYIEHGRLYHDEEYCIRTYDRCCTGYCMEKRYFFDYVYKHMVRNGCEIYILGKDGKLYEFDNQCIINNDFDYKKQLLIKNI